MTDVDVVTGEIVPAHPYDPPQRDTFGILGDAVRLAEVIADTELVPQVMRKRPDAVAAVILAGHELGLGPMQSLQTIDLIQGRPSLSPEGMRALVLSAGHTIVVEATDKAAVVKCHRREWTAEQWTSYTFTIEDAKRADLLGKENWKKYPRAMLTARATSEAARATFADVIAGLSYTAEEIESSTDRATMPPDKGPSPGGGTRARGRSTAGVEGPADGGSSPSLPAAPAASPSHLIAVAALEGRLDRLSLKDREAFKSWRRSRKWNWPPLDADVLASMEAEVAELERAEAESRDTYPVGSPID